MEGSLHTAERVAADIESMIEEVEGSRTEEVEESRIEEDIRRGFGRRTRLHPDNRTF